MAVMLLEHGADQKIRTHMGSTPMDVGIRCKQLAVVDVLQRTRTKPRQDAPMKDGRTPLHAACRHNNDEAVMYLFEDGANPNCADKNGCTPLHEACRKGHEYMVGTLLDHGANPTMRNKDGRTPLDEARARGSEPIIKLILKKFPQRIQLRKRAYHQSTSQVANVEAPSMCNTANKDGWTPLHAACMKGPESVVVMLLKCGADVNIATRMESLHFMLHADTDKCCSPQSRKAYG